MRVYAVLCVCVCVFICVSMCMNVCKCMYVHVCIPACELYTCMYVVHVCTLHTSVCICVRVSSCVWLRVAAIRIQLPDLNPVTEDPDLVCICICVLICIRRVPIRQAISRPIHGMIWRSISVRVVKNRQQFGSKTALFHVIVYFCIIVNYRYL